MPNDLHGEFGKVLRDLRGRAGLSQLELAEASGLTRNYISDLELGRKSPSLRSIERLATALGKRPSDLIVAAEKGRP